MRNVKVYLITLFAIMVFGLTFSVIAGPISAQVAGKEVRFSYWSAGISGGLGSVLEEKKFIENEGVNLKWQRFVKLAEVGRAMLAGSTDFTLGDGFLQAVRLYQESGGAFKMTLANMVADEYFVVKADSPIKKMEDLKGKKIGMGTPASTSYAINIAILEKGFGLKPTDYEKAPVTGAQSLVMLDKGDIQAASLRSMELAKAQRELKLRVIGSFRELWPKVTGINAPPILATMVVNVNFDKENPQLVDKIVKGVIKGVEWGGKNKDEVAKILTKYLNMPESEAKDYAAQWDGIYFASLSDGMIESLIKEAEFFVPLGAIKSAPPKDAFLTRPYKNAIAK